MRGKGIGAMGKKSPDDRPVITDPRFARVHSDPRFQKAPRARLKVPVDARFQHMFSDKSFADPLNVDKRGRPVKKKGKHSLERYYRIDDKVNEKPEDTDEKVNEKEDEEKSECEVSDNDNDSSSSSSDSESQDQIEEDADSQEEKVAVTETATRRLALVNMDWSYVKAVDLLVLFHSFIPEGASIQSVAIYPSQFGLEQMKKEESRGPSIFENSNDNDKEEDEEDDGEVNVEKLREYEKSKLRYYFAVITCDSVRTATHLYSNCDGIEFQRSSNILDLRYVPDDMQFTVEAREITSEVPPADYEAPDFHTRALQQSNVKLTWDDDEPVRVKALRRRFNADELNDMDFKAYLASSSSSSDEGEGEGEGDGDGDGDGVGVGEGEGGDVDGVDGGHVEGLKKSKRDKYRALLALDTNLESKKSDVDMEITFPSGLSELTKKYSDKSKQKKKGDDDGETVWEAQLRKSKEKKKKKKKKKDEEKDDASDFGHVDGGDEDVDDDAFEDPFFKDGGELLNSESEEEEEKMKKKKKNEKEIRAANISKEERGLKKKEEERRKDELELLLLDEDGTEKGVKGYNLKEKKVKGKFKSKLRKIKKEAKKEEIVSSADYNDPRFSALFTSHHFAIDPTDPQFRRSAAKLRVVAGMQQKRFGEVRNNENKETREEAEKIDKKKRKLELTSLVRSLKRNVQK